MLHFQKNCCLFHAVDAIYCFNDDDLFDDNNIKEVDDEISSAQIPIDIYSPSLKYSFPIQSETSAKRLALNLSDCTSLHQDRIDLQGVQIIDHQLFIEIRRMNRLLKKQSSNNTNDQVNNPISTINKYSRASLIRTSSGA